MRHLRSKTRNSLLFLVCICIAGFCLSTLEEISVASVDRKRSRNLQLKNFCESVVQPLLASFTAKYGSLDILDYIDENQSPGEGEEGEDESEGISALFEFKNATEDSIALASESERNSCFSSDYRRFSFPLGETLYGYELRWYVLGYTYCRESQGAYGDDFDITNQDFRRWPQDLSMSFSRGGPFNEYISATCCSATDICQDIQEDFNPLSPCFYDENVYLDYIEITPTLENKYDALAKTLCPENEVLSFALTEEGASVDIYEHQINVQNYVKCSTSFEGFDLPFFSVQMFADTSELHVTCFSCNSTSTMLACEDLRENFLKPTLCNPNPNESLYIVNNDYLASDFLNCEIEADSNHTEILSLPTEYFSGTDESVIRGVLDDFLHCRWEAGAHGSLDSTAFPTFEFIGIEWEEIIEDDFLYHDDYYATNMDFSKSETGVVQVKCFDKCSDGAFCRDIMTQFTSELNCITKNSCRFNSMGSDALSMQYDLEFSSGFPFSSPNFRVSKGVQIQMARNLNKYIECRFGNDPRFSERDYYAFGWVNEDKFDMICYSFCGTIPYCDSLGIRRKEDSKDDLCYDRWLRIDENERVDTTYDYELDFRTGGNGNSNTFQYNIQSLSNNPIMRQYYGRRTASNIPALTTTEEVAQSVNLEALMEEYGIDVPEYLFNDVCMYLTDHVKCATNKKIIKIDMEIANGNGFKANDIKNYFGDSLQELTLGINLQQTKPLPEKFFELSSLLTLSLRARGKLNGSLYSSIGGMTKLKNLDLNQCPSLGAAHEGLTGHIPSEIVTPPLKLIDLGCNKLSGEIPDEFYRSVDTLKSYKVITLNDNVFSGTISNNLNTMVLLNQLSLARNRFSGSFPSISLLSDLKLLDLQKNRDVTDCTQVPSTGNYGFVGPLPGIMMNPDSSLEVVSLNDNCFTGTIPRDIKRIVNLRYLNLQNNDLTGTIPRQVVKMFNLEVLLLGGNPRLDYYVHPVTREFLTENGVIHDLVW